VSAWLSSEAAGRDKGREPGSRAVLVFVLVEVLWRAGVRAETHPVRAERETLLEREE
jgi:hypothetical protein